MQRPNSVFQFLPPGVLPDAKLLLWARGLRAFGDGYISLLLPYYLTLLGFGALEIGVIVTATLLGSGAMTLGVGLIAHRYRQRRLLEIAAMLMIATGVAFVLTPDFWPLLIVAAAGTLNPSSGDATIFGALGEYWFALEIKPAIQAMFMAYGALGIICLLLYRRLSPQVEPHAAAPNLPLGKSKRMVCTLAAVFSLDAFAGGFAVQSLLALWLFERFHLSIAAAGAVFQWTRILSAFSQLAPARLARRFGLVNTMMFTHLPSSIFLILVPLMPNLELALVFLMLRFALSQMDVPARTSYVMAAVIPGERAAAASVTACRAVSPAR
jgi:predicted MFS family arabinose efflux permease